MKKLINKLNHSPQNGSAMLAIFCDLSDEDQMDFYPWLSEDMFPARLNIGFKNCASYKLISGNGSQFMTIYEAPSLGCLYDRPYQKLRENRTPRDANFHNKFQNPQRYTLIWAGPELSMPDSEFAKYLLINRFNIINSDTQSFNKWYFSQFIPNLANLDLFLSIRRYITIEGIHGNFIIRELSNAQSPDLVDELVQGEIFQDQISGIYELVIKSP